MTEQRGEWTLEISDAEYSCWGTPERQTCGCAETPFSLRDNLAALMHCIWRDWTKWFIENLDTAHLEQWRRQMNTCYAALSRDEKNADLYEADKVLSMIESCGYTLADGHATPPAPALVPLEEEAVYQTLLTTSEGIYDEVVMRGRARALCARLGKPEKSHPRLLARIKCLQNELKQKGESRDHWKAKAEATEAQLAQLQVRVAVEVWLATDALCDDKTCEGCADNVGDACLDSTCKRHAGCPGKRVDLKTLRAALGPLRLMLASAPVVDPRPFKRTCSDCPYIPENTDLECFSDFSKCPLYGGAAPGPCKCVPGEPAPAVDREAVERNLMDSGEAWRRMNPKLPRLYRFQTDALLAAGLLSGDASVNAECESLRETLAGYMQEVSSLRSQLAVLREELASLRHDRDELVAHGQELQQALDARLQENASLRAQAATQAELSAAKETLLEVLRHGLPCSTCGLKAWREAAAAQGGGEND
jgi:hypothetical protein